MVAKISEIFSGDTVPFFGPIKEHPDRLALTVPTQERVQLLGVVVGVAHTPGIAYRLKDLGFEKVENPQLE
jgi:hypothetical protein